MQAADDIHSNPDRVSAHYSPFPPHLNFGPPRLSVMRTRQAPLEQTRPRQSTILWTKTAQPETLRRHRNPHPAPQSCCNGSWNPHVLLVTAVDCNIDDSVSRCMLGQPYCIPWSTRETGKSLAPCAAFPSKSHACSFPLTAASSRDPLLRPSRPVASTTMALCLSTGRIWS
jgi:hypothetical protein